MMEEDINRDTRQPHKGSNVCGCLANTRDHQLFTDDYSISLCYSNLRHKSYSEDQHRTTPGFLIAPNLEQIPTFLSPFQTLPQAHPKTLELIAHPHPHPVLRGIRFPLLQTVNKSSLIGLQIYPFSSSLYHL